MNGKLALFLCLASPLTWAADPKIPASELPKHSAFNVANIARNPFDLLGKGGSLDRSVVVGAAQDTEDLASLFRITAVSIDRISIALINKKAFAEKDFFRVRAKGKTINVTVLRVQDGEVDLECDGAVITVPVIKPKPKLEEE